MAGILIYSDKEKFASELVTAAGTLAADLGLGVKSVVVNDSNMAENLSRLGAEVYHIAAEIAAADTAALASALKEAAQKLDSSIILLSSDRRGKELAGRLAQKLGAGCLTDVSALAVKDGQIQCQRNSLGGAAIATQVIETEKKVIALAARTFEAAGENAGGSVNTLDITVPATLKLVETKTKAGDSVDIEAADIIVAVGQGLSGPEELPKVEALAQALGGVVACSKPVATDRKWLSEDRIIGLSGKKCKPSLAILLGISGQVQFTVGIRDARIIVAVNNDENAYILHMADYNLVGDLHSFVEEFKSAL